MHDIISQFRAFQASHSDLYACLNAFRDWVNAHCVNYEVYLEDNWFENKTTIEYIVRCLTTFNIVTVAEDEYENSTADGTWHLGAYVKTYWTVDDPEDVIKTFIEANEPVRYLAPSPLGTLE